MTLINVIQWNGPPSALAWRFGKGSIMHGSQLIVKEHQQAVLMKEGRMLGPFLPGRHTLDTKNLPVLKKLIGIAIDAATPFPAEVWFVNRSIDLNVRWGTSTPIQVQDPIFKIMIPVLGYGMLGVTIGDTKKFLLKLVGALPNYDRETVEQHFRAILISSIKTHIAKSLLERQLSILDIAAHIRELSLDLEKLFKEEFAEFGLDIVVFRIESITTREHDPAVVRLREALARKAEMQILGTDFAQAESFEVMKRAASNEGGTAAPLIGAGLGLGLGANIGAQGSQLSSVVQPTATACRGCSAQVPQGAKFCPGCGRPAQAAEAAGACASCRQPLPSGARFCAGCGTPTVVKCGGCGVESPTDAKFCRGCGSKLSP
jgi:membrane protease subunit (stomatin/prohibitin family)